MQPPATQKVERDLTLYGPGDVIGIDPGEIIRCEPVSGTWKAEETFVAHVEFDRYGRYALVSVWDSDGAVVAYDAQTLEEVKRLPMRKPVGKYNVWNKITRSRGTSR